MVTDPLQSSEALPRKAISIRLPYVLYHRLKQRAGKGKMMAFVVQAVTKALNDLEKGEH